MIDIADLKKIREILHQSSTIAIVGLSPKKERPSNMVAQYLKENGFTIIPVNPGHSTLMGLKCYPDLISIPQHVDIVDIFRNANKVMPIVEQAIQIGASTIWMQQDIINHRAAELARDNQLYVIMDRCIKIDHANFQSNTLTG